MPNERRVGANSDNYDQDDDPITTGKKESNYTVLTINEIIEEQKSQINRVAELFEVRLRRFFFC